MAQDARGGAGFGVQDQRTAGHIIVVAGRRHACVDDDRSRLDVEGCDILRRTDSDVRNVAEAELLQYSFHAQALKLAANGYNRVVKSACDYQNNSALVNEINAATEATEYDLRGCSTVKMTRVTFSIQTDVGFIVNSANAQGVRANSADGTTCEFSTLSPDETCGGKASCTSQQGELSIYGMVMDSNVTGYIYSPCILEFGGGSTVIGQLYSGRALYQGGQSVTLRLGSQGPTREPCPS